MQPGNRSTRPGGGPRVGRRSRQWRPVGPGPWPRRHRSRPGPPRRGEAPPPVPPTTPVFDAFAELAYLAGRTSRVRLATHVYNLALRHPFVGARAVQTLDIVSGGRAEVGLGAGWLESEWKAAGLGLASRGPRLDRGIR